MILEIITPEKKVYSSEVTEVVLPTLDGEVDILPGHQPLLTLLEPGEIQAVGANGREYLAVDKGFARVLGDTLSVLTEAAIDIKAIDIDQVEKAQRRAEAALKKARDEGHDPAEIEQLESIARFAIAQRLAKQKRRL